MACCAPVSGVLLNRRAAQLSWLGSFSMVALAEHPGSDLSDRHQEDAHPTRQRTTVDGRGLLVEYGASIRLRTGGSGISGQKSG